VRWRLLEVLRGREELVVVLSALLLLVLLLVLLRVEKVRYKLLRVLYVPLYNIYTTRLIVISGIHAFLELFQGGCLEVVILLPYI
jgi:hypothetical protein